MALQSMQLAGRGPQPSTTVTCKVPLDIPIPQPKPIDDTQRPETPAIHDPGQSVLLIKPPTRQKVVDITKRDHVVKVQTSRDLLKPQRDRGSVTMELAKFLRTHPPPRDNFMSLPEGAERARKPPFKIFRRQNSSSVSEISPKHLKLPDSAVAAKTIHGHWHIAISIPIEHVHIEQDQTVAKATATQDEPRANSLTHRPITVLKPLMQEAGPARVERDRNAVFGHVDKPQLLQRPRSASVPLLSDLDTSRMMQLWPKRESSLAVAALVKAEDVAKPVLERPENHCPGASGHDSQQPQTKKIITKSSGKDPGVKNTSTNLTYPKLDFDDVVAINAIRSIYLREGHSSKKQSSSSRLVLDLTEFKPVVVPPPSATNLPSGKFTFRQSVTPKRPKADSITSDLSSGNVKVEGVAQDRDSFDTPRSQVTFATNLKPGPAPTKKLPDPPAYASSKPSPKRRLSNSSATRAGRKLSERPARSREGSTSDCSVARRSDNASLISFTDRQSRRERVRAIRSRDMAAARATTMYHRVMASVSAPPVQRKVNRDVLGLPSIEGRLDLPLPHARKQSASVFATTTDAKVQNTVITISPVMLVADIEPSSAHSEDSNFSFSSQKTHPSRGRSHRNTFGKAPTLPRSLTPSLASSDEEDFHGSKDRPASSPGTSGRRSPGGEHHAARIRRHFSLQEDSIDSRMKKIEATNQLMLQSLNAVVELGVGFREVNAIDAELRKVAVDQFDRGLNTIEPIMRELQNAARIGGEELVIDQGDSGYHEFLEGVQA